MAVMAEILDLLRVLVLTIYYIVESWVLFFIPASMKKKNISGKLVLITGAGSGLGRLMANEFAKLGCNLVLWDVNEKGNEETAAEVEKYGTTVKAYKVDLSNREAVYEAAEKVKQEVGHVQILVNNAGIVTGKKLLESPDHMNVKTFEVNVFAHFWTCKAFLPKMIEADSGHIVNIASSAGLVGVNMLTDYCASKFACVGFDEALREELRDMGKLGVKTTVICPVFINTGMFDGVTMKQAWLCPLLEPDYVVEKIMEAVLTEQKFVVVPKTMYILHPLKSLLPLKASSLLIDWMGANRSMDEFKGRQKSE
ncbi:epidermal retinol dehydrogenase 2-like [Tubulanus polymorphus]|uniref:epidermal retinol dehydrogenase 2-like n=1 Tax=Tubulanus polymorphus TaxID=672921 RepID=UPI003DA3EFDC